MEQGVKNGDPRVPWLLKRILEYLMGVERNSVDN